jgi:hypothetical protein
MIVSFIAVAVAADCKTSDDCNGGVGSCAKNGKCVCSTGWEGELCSIIALGEGVVTIHDDSVWMWGGESWTCRT